MGDLMGPAVRVDSQTSLRQVAHDMLECQVEGVVVVDTAGALCGLITEQAVVLTEHSPYRKALPRRLRRCVSLAEGAVGLDLPTRLAAAGRKHYVRITGQHPGWVRLGAC